jgi:hypothetical protein
MFIFAVKMYIDMNSLNFTDQYPDEASCKAKWKSIRDKEGVVCRR